MSVKTSRVFAAWANLNAIERQEFDTLIKKYQSAQTTKEKEGIALEHFNESQRSFVKGTTMNFGATPGSCPTCGR
jgi:limonene-1,2-epoxide hydrolase